MPDQNDHLAETFSGGECWRMWNICIMNCTNMDINRIPDHNMYYYGQTTPLELHFYIIIF